MLSTFIDPHELELYYHFDSLNAGGQIAYKRTPGEVSQASIIELCKHSLRVELPNRRIIKVLGSIVGDELEPMHLVEGHPMAIRNWPASQALIFLGLDSGALQ